MKIKLLFLFTILALLLAACGSAPTAQTLAPVTGPTSSVAEVAAVSVVPASGVTYPIVDTGQTLCYDNGQAVTCPSDRQAFFGQDAQYTGNAPHYQDNGDGTVTDLVTGLMWQQDPGAKMTFEQAVAGASTFNLAGYNDWRLPTIKELYSLILFDGTDSSTCQMDAPCDVTPFIDTRIFKFSYGDTSAGERVIDSQFATSTKYVSTTMNGSATMFGVNFADGRIKGYGTNAMPGQTSGKLFFVLYVRGGSNYGQNSFVDNGNGSVTDNASGLTWMQQDSGAGMGWEAALNYCEALDAAGSNDWRLPSAKELQSIVDYSRSPDTTNSPAIDPLFRATAITNEGGQSDYPLYWSSTTHAVSTGQGMAAVYVSFGRALGYMNNAWLDVHGAGAQRSDPKTGSASDYPQGHGPQGDAVRVENYVRCVRGGNVGPSNGTQAAARPTMQIISTGIESNGPQGGTSTQGPQSGGPNGQQPPQAAIDACSGLPQGSACSFPAPHGTINGSCQTPPQSTQLVCVP